MLGSFPGLQLYQNGVGCGAWENVVPDGHNTYSLLHVSSQQMVSFTVVDVPLMLVNNL